MAISETKMQMVIANYFKDECDVNTSIKQAFEKGFRIGVKKGASANRPQGKWRPSDTDGFVCSVCKNGYRNQPTLMGRPMFEYCPVCGAHMKGADDEV